MTLMMKCWPKTEIKQQSLEQSEYEKKNTLKQKEQERLTNLRRKSHKNIFAIRQKNVQTPLIGGQCST